MSAAPLLDADFVVARRTMEVALALRADAGRRVALFGPSGSGKSTCLEALAGTVALRRGQVVLDGRPVNVARRRRGHRPVTVSARERRVSFVRQPTTLFPHLSARANVAYGLGQDRRARAEAALDLVALHEGRDARPADLSGGQRQRVALARALARAFSVLLLDEPCSALDVASRPGLLAAATTAASEQGAVAILVSHDIGEAQGFGEDLGVIEGGTLLQLGDPGEVVRRPATMRVAQLVGYVGFLRRDDASAWALHPDRFVLGARSDAGVTLACRVAGVHAFGTRFACDLVVADPLLAGERPGVLRAHLDRAPAVGGAVEVTVLDPPSVGIGRSAS